MAIQGLHDISALAHDQSDGERQPAFLRRGFHDNDGAARQGLFLENTVAHVESFVSLELIPLEERVRSGEPLSDRTIAELRRKSPGCVVDCCGLLCDHPERLPWTMLVRLAEQLGRASPMVIEAVFRPLFGAQRSGLGGAVRVSGEDAERGAGLMKEIGFALGAAKRLLADCVLLGKQAPRRVRKLSEMAADILAARTLALSTAEVFDSGFVSSEQFAIMRLFVSEALDRCLDRSLDILSEAHERPTPAGNVIFYQSLIRGVDLAADSDLVAGKLFYRASTARPDWMKDPVAWKPRPGRASMCQG
jgi:hypothetical protein